MPAPTAQAPQFPARAFMRPILINLGSQALTLGGSAITFPLRQLGYLAQLIVHLSGTLTVANADLVFLGFAPYTIIQKFLINAAGSPLPPINASGATMHLWNLRAADFAPFRKGTRVPSPSIGGTAIDAALGTTTIVGSPYSLDGNAFADSFTDSFIVTVGAETIHLWWVLPFALSATDLRGILPLGNASVSTLTITPATKADIVTVAANLTVPVLAVDVTQVYLTPPPAGAPIIGGGVDVSWTQAFDETPQALASTGLNRVLIVPNYTILGLMHEIVCNSIPDLSVVDALNLRLNSSTLFEAPGIDATTFAWRQAMQQGIALPDGVALYDQDLLGDWDWIRTEGITEIESDLTINSGANIVAGDTITTSLRRLVLTQR